jgi:hypothetical protein
MLLCDNRGPLKPVAWAGEQQAADRIALDVNTDERSFPLDIHEKSHTGNGRSKFEGNLWKQMQLMSAST